MSKKLKFIWIDDDPTREPDSISLGKRLNVTIKFESVKNKRKVGSNSKERST